MPPPSPTSANNFSHLKGIPPDFEVKTAIAERMAYINQFVHHSTDPELLKWIRNRLSEPHGTIMRKLDEMGELPKKDLHKG